MDAIEFINKMVRMCAKYPKCEGCPVAVQNDSEDCMAKVPAKQMVTIVEQWSKENPVKTRQSVFLEQFPEANLDAHGCVCVRPCYLSATHRNAYGKCAHMDRDCGDCRREFWGQEVE